PAGQDPHPGDCQGIPDVRRGLRHHRRREDGQHHAQSSAAAVLGPLTMDAAEPKELIQALHDAGIGPLERAVVEQILAHGAECLPLLFGILHSDVDDAVLSRALALIGELGDGDGLAKAFAFFGESDADEDAVTESAEWAARRFTRRLPAESLTVMTELAVDADMPLLLDICKTLAAMPRVHGRAEC